MKYWLVKSEPFKYSFDQFLKDKKTVWDGVRNYAARNFMRDMKKGDHVFFYHSNEGKEIVGLAEVCKESYQDPTTDDANWVVVELKPVKKFKKTIPLDFIKADKILSGMEMIRLNRLSVTPVTDEQYERILQLSE